MNKASLTQAEVRKLVQSGSMSEPAPFIRPRRTAAKPPSPVTQPPATPNKTKAKSKQLNRQKRGGKSKRGNDLAASNYYAERAKHGGKSIYRPLSAGLPSLGKR
jgi:hypothetical protein